MKFAKFLRAIILKNSWERLLLVIENGFNMSKSITERNMNPETFTVRRFIKDQMLSNNLKTQTILTDKRLISSIKTLHKK